VLPVVPERRGEPLLSIFDAAGYAVRSVVASERERSVNRASIWFSGGTMATVAYLDLLGFRQAIRRSDGSAIGLLEGYNAILSVMDHDLRWASGRDLTAAGHDAGATEWTRRLSGVRTLLPMSDSLVAVGEGAPGLVYAMAHFLAGSALFHLKLDFATKPPVLFRGGIAGGEVEEVRQLAIEEGKATLRRNVLGQAVVEAVKLEERIKTNGRKGPLVWMKDVGALTSREERLVGPTDIDGIYELLWPIALIREANGNLDILHLNDLLEIATKGEEAFGQHADVAAHYRELRRLIVRSTLKDDDGEGARHLEACGVSRP
jgi:hypothetical protein